ncbi:GNAT family N-acetyltransferase [Pedobacter duraquae]|uniref:Putative acetyltransferase n=1 Tax=Pedobacter duraquae TaxID=425511 RepID=A0A4R6IG03_9SPHI|nr:GNAT family N-acetyltransferase [Pedobacter duraquae]TDO20736.1 putative acetyltransferase [Pedobacter duraquae]
MSVIIRKINSQDDVALAIIIKKTFDEFQLPKEGTVYADKSTDHLSNVFAEPGSVYLIAEEGGKILGGCGFFPTAGLPEGCVELVKFYLSESARGKGLGKMLIDETIKEAKLLNYTNMYLESFPSLTAAIAIYNAYGFKKLNAPLGNSGHFACNVWMLKSL